MRKLLAAGVIAAGALGVSVQANALETIYEIDGTFSDTEQGCTQVTLLFSGADCTYGRNRAGAGGAWLGPQFSGAHYPQDGVRDQPGYTPTSGVFDRPSQTFAPAAPDGKLAAPITGTLTIDDRGTPGDPTDDRLSAAFSIGTMARNIATGQFTRAVQRWTSMNHTMLATPVNPLETVANASGGVDYVIGTRGFPTSRCSKSNASDCFPTANSSASFTDLDNNPDEDLVRPVSFWVQIPVGQIGIERIGLLGDPGFTLVQPPPNPPTGNRGATTTANFTGYSCVHNNGAANDCTSSVLVWGAAEPPGFDNMIMKVSTDSTGAITAARIYWTEEYFIGLGGAPAGYDNSFQAGTIDFTGTLQSLLPDARDFAASVIADSASNTLDAIGNSVRFGGPVTITIVTPPAQGTASVNGNGTINYDATGVAASVQTIVYQATDGADTDEGTITVTVEADVDPVAPDGTITISTQGAAPGSGTVGTVNVASLAGYSAGNAPGVVTITTPPNAASGTATVTGGTTIRFQPAATFFAGTDTIGYTITDRNGDTDTGVITVTIPDLTPVLNDGAITTDQDRASPQLTLGITPGNGSVAQHTLTVSAQGTSGSCALSGTKVTYTPNGGFFGTDSCVIQIADGDGDTDTGTISVTVIQADDKLKLPGGGSAVDLWSLSLLGTLPLLRRRRRN
jgi:hypothetical protein